MKMNPKYDYATNIALHQTLVEVVGYGRLGGSTSEASHGQTDILGRKKGF